MPKLTLTAFEPIEVEIIGVGVFRIESVSSELMQKFMGVVSDYEADPKNMKPDMLAEMLMRMLPGITKEQAMIVDIRHILRIADYLAQQISNAAQPEAGTGKN